MNVWVFGQPSPTAIFCPHCQSILNLPDVHLNVRCPDCSFQAKLSDISVTESGDSKTESKSHVVVPDVQQVKEKPKTKRATVKENCPRCNNDTMTFYTLQLRSADEGQTVFYDCPRCGYSYSTNT